MSHEAFVYLWFDTKSRMFYLGYHKGTPDDSYTHSSTVMESFTKTSIPSYMRRRILAMGTAEEMIELENKLLGNRKEKCWDKYYNVIVAFPPPPMYGEDHPMWKGGVSLDPEKVLEYRREHYAKNVEKIREKKREYHANNPERAREYQSEYNAKNREKVLEYQSEYRAKNRENLNEKQREYHAKNLEKVHETQREYRAKNREKIREKQREYNAKNREKVRERQREHYAKNAERVLEQQREYRAKKKANK